MAMDMSPMITQQITPSSLVLQNSVVELSLGFLPDSRQLECTVLYILCTSTNWCSMFPVLVVFHEKKEAIRF